MEATMEASKASSVVVLCTSLSYDVMLYMFPTLISVCIWVHIFDILHDRKVQTTFNHGCGRFQVAIECIELSLPLSPAPDLEMSSSY